MINEEKLKRTLEGTTQSVAEAKEIISNFEVKSKIQAKANTNFNDIQKMFVRDIDGNVFYPNEYCGSWIDGELLCIGLTDTSDKIIEKYCNAVTFKDNIKFEKMLKSLNMLKAESNDYIEYLKENNIFCSVYPNVQENKCEIEVINNTASNAINTLRDKLTKVDEKYKFKESDLIVKQGGYVTEETDIVGGMPETIISSSTRHTSTVGMCGTITMSSGNTYDGIISCGHGKNLNDTVLIDNHTFGTVCIERFSNNSYGDFACIKRTSDDTLTNKVKGWTSAYLDINSYAFYAAVNSEVLKYGQKTGFASGTLISNDCSEEFSISSESSYTIKGLSKSILTSGDSADGDSGGPYFCLNTYTESFTFVGVHTGSKIENSKHYLYFTPCNYFSGYFTPLCK